MLLSHLPLSMLLLLTLCFQTTRQDNKIKKLFDNIMFLFFMYFGALWFLSYNNVVQFIGLQLMAINF